MCIKALDLDVDLIKLDMYQKYEHKKPWFVKVNDPFFVSKSNKHCEVLVSCSDWVDLIKLHACNLLSKAFISTACQQ